MAIKTKASLKSFFEKGDRPTSAEFSHLVDTFAILPVSSRGFLEVETTASSTAHNPSDFSRSWFTEISTTAEGRNFLAITSASSGGGGAAGQEILNANTTASVVSQLGAQEPGTTILQADNTAAAVDALGPGVGAVLQGVRQIVTAVFQTADVIPLDTTPPLNTEGSAWADFTFTPQASDSNVEIEAMVNVGVSGTGTVAMAIFTNAAVTAIGAGRMEFAQAGSENRGQVHAFSVVSGIGAGPVTVSARLGPNAAGNLTTLNGAAGVGEHGEARISYVRVTEYRDR